MPIEFVENPLLIDGDSVSLDFTKFYSAREVNVPPSLNDISSAFGTPAEAGSGRWNILDANGAGTNVYLCVCDGTKWWYTALTEATD